MVFSSVSFLYLFLPVALLLYFAAPRRAKNYVLLAMSLVFYFVGGQELVLLMLGAIVLNYVAGLLIEHFAQNRAAARAVLIVALVLNFALLGYFKYADFFIETVNSVFGTDIVPLEVVLPIGISFYLFQSASYTIDVYRRTVSAQKNPLLLATYVTMYPQLIAGPIVRYQDVCAELENRRHTWEGFSLGVRRFTIGLAKKVLIANNIAEIISIANYSSEDSVLFAWMSAIGFTLQVYFDFSGYSDMAIGLGHMMGFRFLENFNYPYISSSITEFWRRWHMSLSSWFRDYVYIPLGGNRKGLARQILNITIVWFLTGLWHGAEWSFALWGLLYAALLIIEKLFLGKLLKKLPKLVGVLYTLFFVIMGFVIFNAADVGKGLAQIGAMFGAGGIPLAGTESLYYLRSFAGIFIVAAIGATPLAATLVRKIPKRVLNVLEPIFCAALLLVCTGYLIDGSFNPFLYFRF